MRQLFLIAIVSCFLSCKNTSTLYSREIKDNLAAMWKVDQQIQNWDESRLEDATYLDSMKIASEKVFTSNTEVIKRYFKKYSYPGVKENGKETSMHFWTLVQHADHDVKFQQEVLAAMKKQLKSNNINRRNYAYLYDRVQKNLGKPQLYGTQIDWDSGKPEPYNLQDPENVNERRKEMELEPIEEYLNAMMD